MQALWHIVLPQTLRAMLPSLANTWVSLTKDTSLAYIVGVTELSTIATQVNGRSMGYAAEVFAAVAVLYFLICFAIECAAAALLALRGVRLPGSARIGIARMWRPTSPKAR